MNRKSISEQNQTNSGCGRVLIGLCGLVFLTFGVFFIVITAVLPYLNSRAARSWATAPCTILTSDVDSHTDSDGHRSYSPNIEYAYVLDGGTLQGDQYSFSNTSGSSAVAHEIANQYPVGADTICYFDPSDPSNSVLNRDFNSSLAWMALFPLIFVLIGAIGILAAWMGWGCKRQSRSEKVPLGTQPHGAPAIPGRDVSATGQHADDLEDARWSVPMKLKTKQSRWAALLLTFAFATFWNGIVSVFIFALIFDSVGFWPRIGLGLFLIPFVLIGLMMILACGYMFLQLFNPRVEVALSSGAVPLGGTVDLAWEVIGRSQRLKKLKLEIQAEQVATYQRGTDTRTDQDVFELIPVVEIENQAEIKFGSATVQIPTSTMHTHAGKNNQVTWSVVVHGEIGWWPDLNESFPFRVTPVTGANA